MKATIDKINQNNFMQFISKMKSIENFISLNVSSDVLDSVAYLPQRDAIKRHTIELDQVFQGFKIENPKNKKIKIAFFDGNKLIEALRQFKTDMIFAEIDFTENDNDFIANQFKIYNDSMQINLACSDPSIGFKELSQDQISQVFDENGTVLDFDLDNETLQKIKSLSLLEKDETFQIESTTKDIKILGTTYSTVILNSDKGINPTNVIIFKKYLNLLDREDYQVKVFKNKVIFFSNQTGSTSLVVSPCLN